MIRIGFIGYGSMGSMLLQGFIKSGVIAPEEIIVSTRTKSKLLDIRNNWAGVNIARDNAEAAQNAKYIFVCVKPLEVKNVLKEIKGFLKPDSVVISIAGSGTMENIENLTHGKVIRLIPSLTSEVLEGISLVCCNKLVDNGEMDYIEQLLNGISTVKRVREEALDLAAELTSCAPGFLAAILNEFVQSAMRQNRGLSEKDAEEMVVRTFYGTAKVLAERNMGFEEMIQRVATKGGITEEGVKVFRAELPQTFDKVFEVTLNKRKTVLKMVDAEFRSKDQ